MKRYYLLAPDSAEALRELHGQAGPLHWLTFDCHLVLVQTNGDAWSDPTWTSLGHLLDPTAIAHHCAGCLGKLGVEAADSMFVAARKIGTAHSLAFAP